LVRQYNGRIKILLKELRNKVVPCTPEKAKILRTRVLRYRIIRSGQSYIDKTEHRIKKYRTLIKTKPNPNVLKKIKLLSKRVKICRKLIRDKKVIAARRRIFKTVMVNRRIFKGCLRVRKSISRSVLRQWSANINRFKDLKAKASVLQRKIYRRKIIKLRVMKSGKKYYNKTNRRF
jgi:hypothetical protein